MTTIWIDAYDDVQIHGTFKAKDGDYVEFRLTEDEARQLRNKLTVELRLYRELRKARDAVYRAHWKRQQAAQR